MGAKACNLNPFENDSLTDGERRRPSRQLPNLSGEKSSTRYLKDFEELGFLGKGDFGTVTKARSRIDGCAYAVKRGRLQNRASDKNRSLYEVFAMSSLSGKVSTTKSTVSNAIQTLVSTAIFLAFGSISLFFPSRRFLSIPRQYL